MIDFSAGAYDKKNAAVRSVSISLLHCPSYPGMNCVGGPTHLQIASLSNYAGCHNDLEVPIDENNNGVLFLNSRIRDKDVTDGISHTIYVGEKLGSKWDLGWMSGTRATLRNAGTAINQTPWDDGHGSNMAEKPAWADLVDNSWRQPPDAVPLGAAATEAAPAEKEAARPKRLPRNRLPSRPIPTISKSAVSARRIRRSPIFCSATARFKRSRIVSISMFFNNSPAATTANS